VKNYIQYCTKSDFNLIVSPTIIEKFIKSNPESYYTYWIVGDYYKKQGELNKAIFNYNLALTKVVATEKEAKKIKELITNSCQKK
jgi:Tfp pilus assembly protein PilF